ncbi:DUF1713 domain protein [Quillaja saponaria]|uniref:DUF1713 domain protein n=1 Tax=Quillaja saponaria TaxID=32244 RepID=A0AAD7VGI8_QUISA|nr:DUF1713 domain protein [Quillaja saponaria]
MASSFQKLLRKSPATRIFTAFHNSPLSNPTLPLVFHRSHLIETKPEFHQVTNLSPSLCSEKAENFFPSQLSVIFPSYPFGFPANPISSTGFDPSEEDVELDDSPTVRADSVKKKRKRKMNKHKYNKLRRRLRRQT